MNILHFSPHPDDEILGAGGALQELQASGQEITNWALTLGSNQKDLRRQELLAANELLGYQLLVADGQQYRGASTDWRQLERHWREQYRHLDNDFQLFIAPSPLDGHPLHEAVGRLALSLSIKNNTALWFWGLWADLPVSNLLAPVSSASQQRLAQALDCYPSQFERFDLQRLLSARQQIQALLGPGRIYGWQETPAALERAETLLEVVPQGGQLVATKRRTVDYANPLTGRPSGRDLSQLLNSPSWSSRLLLYR